MEEISKRKKVLGNQKFYVNIGKVIKKNQLGATKIY